MPVGATRTVVARQRGREDATRARGASAAGVGANARADAADMVASEARREVSLRPRCVPRATSHSRASSRLSDCARRDEARVDPRGDDCEIEE